MTKKIALLNDELKYGQLTPVLFPFPPISLPVSELGVIVDEGSAISAHYATFIYSICNSQFYLFEFNHLICNGVIAYKERYKKMSRVEILLSRDNDGLLKMTVGNNKIEKRIVSKAEFDEFLFYHDKLYNRYMSKKGYVVSDFV